MYFKIVESELQDAHSNEGVQWRNISHSLLFYTHHCAHTHWMWNGGMKFDSLFHYLKLLRGDLKLFLVLGRTLRWPLRFPPSMTHILVSSSSPECELICEYEKILLPWLGYWLVEFELIKREIIPSWAWSNQVSTYRDWELFLRKKIKRFTEWEELWIGPCNKDLSLASRCWEYSSQ